MVKRTVEIDDGLSDAEDTVKDEVKDDFLEWVEDNSDSDDFDNYYQHQGADFVHECVDSNVPIYYSDIDGWYYLYGNEFEEAYDNAGIGRGGEDNHKQVAIYCYLEQIAYNYHNELKDAFDDWRINYGAIDAEVKEANNGKTDEEIEALLKTAQEESVKEFIKTMKEE